MLKTLPSPWEVWGIDLSKAMLRQARRKVPRGRFVCQDMTRFRLTQKFDAIICLLDSINHLTGFTGWRQTFRRARQHLVRGGVFICDVYTVRKLHRLDKGAPFVQRVGRNYFIVRASYKGRGLVLWGDTGCARLRLPNAPFLFPRFGVPCANALTEFAFTVRTGVGLPSSQVAYTSSAADLRQYTRLAD